MKYLQVHLLVKARRLVKARSAVVLMSMWFMQVVIQT